MGRNPHYRIPSRADAFERLKEHVETNARRDLNSFCDEDPPIARKTLTSIGTQGVTKPTFRKLVRKLTVTEAQLRELIGQPQFQQITTSELADMAEGGNKSALDQLTVLASKGDAEALTRLGIMYKTGRGVSKESLKAESFLLRAATLGSSLAMRELGVMFEEDCDPIAAVKWYSNAAKLGDIKASFKLGLMYWRNQGVPKMETPERLKEAFKLIPSVPI
jgi:TPR repeat protein